MKKITLLISILLLCIPSISFAKDNDKTIGSNYIITPIYEDNQNPNQTGRFQLSLKEDSNYPLSFRIRNDSNKAITLSTQPLNAITESGGSIGFINGSDNNQYTEKGYEVASHLSIDETVELKANEEKVIPFNLNTKDLEDGTYLGAISFREEQSGESTSISNEEKQTGTIETNYEIEKILPIEFTIGKPTAIDNKSLAKSFVKSVRQEDGNLKIDVENDNAALVDGGKIDITVLKDASKVFSFQTNLQLAPKSKTTLEIPWNGDLSSGDYKASVETTFNKNSSKKSFDFSIAKKEVEEVEKQTFDDEKIVVESNSNGLLVGTLIGAFVVFLILVLIILRQRKVMKKYKK
ncbi:DUF916 domain-containing protein (plasmid) [Niallia circulans]|uniref:DUF916 domain-containing protein n=1 Tax=Niallia circulans TaxID=1397 RepID=A0A553SQL3_NIACI|nr:DUF916 domain-containing protein [Niallia circulans]TRZ39283.1 DUF916 domain-containing protein [Niallia circulans]